MQNRCDNQTSDLPKNAKEQKLPYHSPELIVVSIDQIAGKTPFPFEHGAITCAPS